MNRSKVPDNYHLLRIIDPDKGKGTAWRVTLCAVLLSLALIGGALLLGPSAAPLFTVYGRGLLENPTVRLGLTLAGLYVYCLLHELIHWLLMRGYSSTPAKYGFSGLYPAVWSDACFDRRSFTVLNLAPVAVLGLVLLALQWILPRRDFWYVYLIQVMNLSGLAGDCYVLRAVKKMPEDVLLCCQGSEVRAYTRNTQEEQP